jgi:hypothetical protein
MELALTFTNPTTVSVLCDGQPSHTFPYASLFPGKPDPTAKEYLLKDPVAFGQGSYAALFPTDSPAYKALRARPKRVLLVAEDPALDAVPWVFARAKWFCRLGGPLRARPACQSAHSAARG